MVTTWVMEYVMCQLAVSQWLCRKKAEEQSNKDEQTSSTAAGTSIPLD